MRRQARLFAITEYLRARKTGVTAGMLAERFGVTVRTVYRDLDALRLADLPLHAEQGRGGGFALDRHYSLPPINLNAREAALLSVVASFAVRTRLLPFTDTLQGALDKVRGALSLSAQRELLPLLEQLEFVGVPALGAPAAIRRSIEEAWFSQSPLDVRYRNAEGEVTSRTLYIEGVLMERTRTLLKCRDAQTRELRTLRLDRVEAASACRRV